MHRSKYQRLFDHLVGARQERRRDSKPQRLSGLEVNHQLKLCRLLDGKVCRLDALQNFGHEQSTAPKRDGTSDDIMYGMN